MTEWPEHDPAPRQPLPPEPAGLPAPEPTADAAPDDLLFRQYWMPPPPREERIPHIGHLGILLLLGAAGLLFAILSARVGLRFGLFGITTLDRAATDIHYTLLVEGVFYMLTFAGAWLLFPHLWGRGFFAGLQWRFGAALRRAGYLFGASAACFGLALINGMLLPGPDNAPIDKMFRMPGAAWLLFAFGVTFAPFFEELAFRGFLLPALATAFDWCVEHATGQLPRPLHRNGHPRWSLAAMVTSTITTSLLFALLHAEQTGTSLTSLGPFVLLACVSCVLCAIRLMTRSLAASVAVHACYNFLLFALMFLGTEGFRHLENM